LIKFGFVLFQAELFKNVKEQTIPAFIKQMETLLRENNDGSGFFVGTTVRVGFKCINRSLNL
jgi:DNA-binding winged helix-turn-helix (wHTH) protein